MSALSQRWMEGLALGRQSAAMDASIALSSVWPQDSDELGSAEPAPCVSGDAMHV